MRFVFFFLQEEARRKERQALFQILDTDSDGDLNPKEGWGWWGEDGAFGLG